MAAISRKTLGHVCSDASRVRQDHLQPGFPPHPVSLAEALELLTALTQRPGHRFWSMDVSLEEAVRPFVERLFGHRQVTDAYLLGLAMRHHGRLVTLDNGFPALAGKEFRDYVLLL